MPVPRAPGVARTARTVALSTTADLALLIDDLHRRLDHAGRDTRQVDITFSENRGGNPGDDGFAPDEHLSAIAELAALGVTWIQVRLPGDSLDHAVETIERYGAQVIAASDPDAGPDA